MSEPWRVALEVNEQVLWTGRPGVGAPLTRDNYELILCGAFFSIVSVFLFLRDDGDDVIRWILLTFGLLLAFWRPTKKLITVQLQAYAVTNRRALIGTYFLSRQVTSIPLNIWTHTFAERGARGSIEIGPQPKRKVDNHEDSVYLVEEFIGFYKVRHPEAVEELIEQVKRYQQ